MKRQAGLYLIGLLAFSILGPDATVSFAQVYTASIVGRVQDSSGAIIPGAEVHAKRVSTNEVFSAITTDTGDYRIVNLPIDSYEVRSTMAGFKTEVRSEVKLEVGRTVRIDFNLTVGQLSESVEIKASVPVLQTESPETGQLIDNTKINGLPLNQRDVLGALGGLSPGVAPARGSRLGNGIAFTVRGQRQSDNIVLLDGAIVNNGNNSVWFFTNPDAVQEYEIKTGLYGADYGIKPGGQFSVVTKSGTNSLHGTIFEYLRNDNLDARNFFDVGDRPEFKRNQFGATLGGPVYIPKLFNGKDKMWFFFSYSGERIRRFQSLTGMMPTVNEKRGIFSSPITDPLTGQPFDSNTIPTSRINPVSTKLLPFWPDPNTASGRGFNFTSPNSTQDVDNNQVIAKGDLKWSDTNRWSGRFLYSSFPVVSSNVIQTFSRNDRLANYAGSVSNIRTFKGRIINDFTYQAYLRPYNPGASANGTDSLTDLRGGFGTSLAIPNFPIFPSDVDGVPTTSVTNFSGIGDSTFVGPTTELTWEARDNVSFDKGAHSFKVGYHYKRYGSSDSLDRRSTFTFIPRYTGNAFADFLLGYPSQTSIGGEAFRGYYFFPGHHFFFQDSWKVARRLTMNLGLRYEYRGPWRDTRGFFSNFDPETGQLFPPLQNKPLQPYESGKREPNVPLVSVSKNGWLPRFGLAYRLTEKTVIRGGYGAYGNEMIVGMIDSAGGNPRPNAGSQVFLSDATRPTISLSDPFNPAVQAPGTGTPNIVAVQRELPQTIVHSWGVSIQQELTPGTVFEIGYQGSHTVHDFTVVSFNDATPGTTPREQRRPYPQYQTINMVLGNGDNRHNGLEVKIERRPGPSGLSMLLAYTWAKTLDTVGGRAGVPGDPRGISRNLSLKDNRGLAEGNIPSRLSFMTGYELPFGPGKQLSNATARSAR